MGGQTRWRRRWRRGAAARISEQRPFCTGAIALPSKAYSPSRAFRCRLLRNVQSPAYRRRVGALCQDYAKVCRGQADEDVIAAHDGALH